MNRGSLVQDILDEVSSRIISFQIRLHLLITLVKSSEYFKFIESLRTCIMASHNFHDGKCGVNQCIFWVPYNKPTTAQFEKSFQKRLKRERSLKYSGGNYCETFQHHTVSNSNREVSLRNSKVVFF